MALGAPAGMQQARTRRLDVTYARLIGAGVDSHRAPGNLSVAGPNSASRYY